VIATLGGTGGQMAMAGNAGSWFRAVKFYLSTQRRLNAMHFDQHNIASQSWLAYIEVGYKRD
jgi:hypothetical protein